MGDILTTESFAVWANSDSTELDHPITEALPLVGKKSVRVSLSLSTSTSSTMEATVFYEFTWDGTTWVGRDTIGPTQTGDGTSTTASGAFEALTLTNAAPRVRFGVAVKNGTGVGTALNLAYATMRLEFKDS